MERKPLEVVEELKEIVSNQTQVRTNKLKPLVEELEAAIKNISDESEIVKENRYNKRKATMYELKISKLQKELRKWKKLAK